MRYIFPAFFLFYSCVENHEQHIIASVYDKDLFISDVIAEMPTDILDSTVFFQQYINNWVRKEIMLYHAEINLDSDFKNYNKQIEDYRNSLLIYAYQQQLLKQNFDTIISSKDISEYYQKYQDEFKLNHSVFRGRYIIVDKDAPKLKNILKWYSSNKAEDLLSLEDYCQSFAKEYYLLDTNWQYFSVIKNKLPIFIDNEEQFLKSNKTVFLQDNKYNYYVYIKDYKIKGSISPLMLEQQKIYNVLLHKNKIEYLNSFEDKLYQNNLALEKIKIY